MSTKSYNILITGASGLLGRVVHRYLTEATYQAKYPLDNNQSYLDEFKWNCLGLSYSRARENLKQLDLNNFDQVNKLVDEFKPDAIIHCAAERRVEVVEKDFDAAIKLNSMATKHLAQLSAQKGIFFVYISTDYVFDGKNPPYKITDQPNPINNYGVSKLQGEKVTLEASKIFSISKEHCIVRVPVLYGYTEPKKLNESAVNILYEKVSKTGEEFLVDDVQVRYPTHTIDVARFIAQLLRKNFEINNDGKPIEGILHCSASDAFTKYSMSCVMADLFSLSKDHIKQDFSAKIATSSSTSRPNNCQLDTSQTFDLLSFKTIMKFENSIKECLEFGS